MGRQKLKGVGGDDFVIGPHMVDGKIPAMQIQVEETSADVLRAIDGGQQFDLVTDFTFQRIPPWPAGADLNPKCATRLRLAEIHGDLRRRPAALFQPSAKPGAVAPG